MTKRIGRDLVATVLAAAEAWGRTDRSALDGIGPMVAVKVALQREYPCPDCPACDGDGIAYKEPTA